MSQPLLPGLYPEELGALVDNLNFNYHFGEKLGQGKHGAAYRLESKKTGRSVCLKTISPQISSQELREKAKEAIRREIQILRPLRHQCIPELIGFSSDEGSEWPFYLCTYHPGVTFEKFKTLGNSLTSTDALLVVQSLMDAFEYLHQQGRTHCDFHHNNIMISEHVLRDGILIIDFGSGHRGSDTSSGTDDRGDLRLKPVGLQSHYREHVNREEAQQQFELTDFKSLGHLLALMAKPFFGAAAVDQQLAYNTFCQRLQDETVKNWDQAREEFAPVADPRYLISDTDRQFTTESGAKKFVRLPVTGDVAVGRGIAAVINTKAFQKLRRLKQLSFCDWVYPGASHNRLEHVLGVMEVARHALEHLSRQGPFRRHFRRESVSGALLAALVHDIGHYPFAHMLEQYVASRFPGDDEAKRIVRHETNTLDILERDSEVVSAINSHWGEATRLEAIRILEGKLPVLSELLDGPIDCDKLDYVRRDAHHCGVTFGTGVDPFAIVHSLCCTNENPSRLAVDISKVPAVEGFLIAQEQMLREVYWNEVVRGVCAMFHAAIALIVRDNIDDLKRVVDGFKKCNSEEGAVRDVLIKELEAISPGSRSTPPRGRGTTRNNNRGRSRERRTVEPGNARAVKALLHFMMGGSYPDIYRAVRKYQRSDTVPTKLPAGMTIFNAVLSPSTVSNSTVPVNFEQVKRLRKCYLGAVSEKLGSEVDEIGDYDILIDVPFGKSRNRNVLVKGALEQLMHITDVTHLDESLFSQPAAFSAPVRVFVSPTLFGRIGDRLESVVVAAEEQFYSRKT